jgi:hypothetical protein
MPANGLGHFEIKSTLISWALTFAPGSISQVRWNQSLLVSWTSQPRSPPKKRKIPKLVRYQGDIVEEVLSIPAKSPFKHLILETLLWSYSYSMSSNAKSPLEGLKASECKKGKLGARPPIPYIPNWF